MNKRTHSHTQPPRWASAFLTWYCDPSLLEDLEGDLEEYFHRNVKTRGNRIAKLIYVIDVIKFCRPYLLRKPDFLNLLIQWIMLNSYIKTSGRSILRNKLFSFINIAGLAISMSVGLLLIAMLSDLHQFDRFNKNYDRIYRVVSNYQFLEHADDSWLATTSLRTGGMMKDNIPGIGPIAILERGVDNEVKAGSKTVLLEGLWANENVFEVFTFSFISGNPATALKNPWSVVLTQTAAKKLFGNADPIGKQVEFSDKKEYSISGVIQDVPSFSHLKFDFLVSLSTNATNEKTHQEDLKWDNMWTHYVYFVRPENTTPASLEKRLAVLAKNEDKTLKNTKIRLALQPLSGIAVGKEMNNQLGATLDTKIIWILSILTLVVMISACFNYTNLSIARSLRRSREVGIRMVIGARKSNVLGQFITEAVIISLFSLGVAFVLFLLLKTPFLGINQELSDMLKLNLTLPLIGYFILLAIGIGLAAGFLPALFFSSINAVQVLKDAGAVRVFRHLNLRKALIVIQYTISVMFISAAIIGYKQYKHFLAFDLGFKTENILNIRLQGVNQELLRKELSEMPEVSGIASSTMITSIGNYFGAQMKYTNPNDSLMVYWNRIDENYLPLHGHKLLAGTNFTSKGKRDTEEEVIINETIQHYFKIGNGTPESAIGEIILINRKPMKVIAVMKNFYYGRADNAKELKVIFRCGGAEPGYLNVKINSKDWPGVLSRLESIWKKLDDVHPLEAKFYDDQIAKTYGDLAAMLKVIGFLAFLAIGIASLGLLGMIVFMTETRLKEIGIRKVLGASEGNLMYLMSRGFFLLLLISAFIGVPSTYIFFDRIVLNTMGNHAPLQWFDLVKGVIIILVIALVMIGMHTLKAARSNPARVLKSE